MPRPAEDETGAPSVYQRQEGGPAPAYEEYRDPATAHGWLNAYDETRELPRITPGAPAPVPASVPAAGRADRRRAARGARGRRGTYVVAAVGAVGAAAALALITGLPFSSSPGDGTQGGQGRTKHTAGESSAAAAPGQSPRTASVTASPKSAAAAAPATTSPSAPPDVSASASPSATATRGASTAPSPTATTAGTTSTPVDGSHGWGHGRGGGGRSH